MNKTNILKILEKLQNQALLEFRAQIKGIFGSYVRAEHTTQSDVDVLVEFTPEADLFDFIGLSNLLEEKLNCPVDLVPIDAIREELKTRILEEAEYI